jgi:hypothetical protein
MLEVTFKQGDLTQENVDVIVNNTQSGGIGPLFKSILN